MTTRIRLITRGDDAGSSKSANRAIRESFQRGVLKNASVMAIGPAVTDAVETLGHLPGLGLGLHVALNCEWDFPKWGPLTPAARVPSLIDDQGYLTRNPTELDARQPPVEEMILEVKAQLARLRHLGLRVDYLDQHMGVGRVTGLNQALADLCQAEGLINADHLFKSLPRATTPDLPFIENVLARLKEAPDATHVLITHPACDDAEMQAFQLPGHAPGQVVRQRDEDRRMLQSPELRDYAAQSGIEFVRFTDCV